MFTKAKPNPGSRRGPKAAMQKAVAEARRHNLLEENAHAFTAQAAWHERNGHPLAEIIVSPGKSSWAFGTLQDD